MAKGKKNGRGSKLFWRVAISLVGVALILIAVGNLSLYYFGESAPVSVNTRRVGGADSSSTPNRRYEWSLDYTFKDNEGNEHSGHTTRRGSDYRVTVDDRVYYFEFAPFISALEGEAKPSIAQPFYIIIGAFLIYVMNKMKKTPAVRHKAVKKPNGEIDVPELDDYDDSVEEVFHENE